MSNYFKTPLTAIISYIELLMRQEDLSPEVLDYVRILDEKSQKLKTMVLDVFEVSKAAAGQLPVIIEELEFGKLLRQTLADMGERIEESGLVLKTEFPEDAIRICADGDRLYRVFQNLLQNALTYSLTGSRVFVTLTRENKIATAVIKNTSKSELASGIDFTQRFVRGDGSRTDGGSGLGLSIAKSFTEACGGSFVVEVDADLFTARVSFPVV
ncbi:MAG: HAMP domain-containing sensor histidine kinase [Oscillospiraceae bacterium]